MDAYPLPLSPTGVAELGSLPPELLPAAATLFDAGLMTECWVVRGCENTPQQLRTPGKSITLARLVWIYATGAIPKKGWKVARACQVYGCFNPYHAYMVAPGKKHLPPLLARAEADARSGIALRNVGSDKFTSEVCAVLDMFMSPRPAGRGVRSAARVECVQVAIPDTVVMIPEGEWVVNSTEGPASIVSVAVRPDTNGRTVGIASVRARIPGIGVRQVGAGGAFVLDDVVASMPDEVIDAIRGSFVARVDLYSQLAKHDDVNIDTCGWAPAPSPEADLRWA